VREREREREREKERKRERSYRSKQRNKVRITREEKIGGRDGCSHNIKILCNEVGPFLIFE
jgi:hypothetical protein